MVVTSGLFFFLNLNKIKLLCNQTNVKHPNERSFQNKAFFSLKNQNKKHQKCWRNALLVMLVHLHLQFSQVIFFDKLNGEKIRTVYRIVLSTVQRLVLSTV